MAVKGSILIVEDDVTLAAIYKKRLEQAGFEVKLSQNGEEALSEAVAYKPTLILLDLMMPKIDGFNVLDILRNTPETTNTKVIVLSALDSPNDIERATKLGADRYLVKSSVNMDELVGAIELEMP